MKLFEILLVVLTLGSGLPAGRQAVPGQRRAASAGLLDEEPVLVDYSRRSSRCWRSC
jgi:signal peptidase I